MPKNISSHIQLATTPAVLTVPKDSNIKKYDDIAGHSTQVVQGTSTATQLTEFNDKHSDKPVELNYTNENIDTNVDKFE